MGGDGIDVAFVNPVEPLAVAPELDRAASKYSARMLDQNFFAHTDPTTGKSPFDRMRDEGYNYRSAGENIGLIGSSSSTQYTQARLDRHHVGLWNSDGHRDNILRSSFSEIGLGYDWGSYVWSNGRTYTNTSAVTQKFGDRGDTFLTGVVIDDADGDSFYDIGEGQAGVRITAYNNSVAVGTSTWEAGGYTLQLDPGTYTVVFEGGDLNGHYVTTVTIGRENVKLDVVEDRDAVQDTAPDPTPAPQPTPTPPPSPTPTPGNGQLVEGSSGRDKLKGSNADEIFASYGGKKDTVTTGGGNDIVVFGSETTNGTRENEVIFDFNPSNDTIALAAGIDVTRANVNKKGDLVLRLSGDGDRIILKGGVEFDEINFITATDDLLA